MPRPLDPLLSLWEPLVALKAFKGELIPLSGNIDLSNGEKTTTLWHSALLEQTKKHCQPLVMSIKTRMPPSTTIFGPKQQRRDATCQSPDSRTSPQVLSNQNGARNQQWKLLRCPRSSKGRHTCPDSQGLPGQVSRDASRQGWQHTSCQRRIQSSPGSLRDAQGPLKAQRVR